MRLGNPLRSFFMAFKEFAALWLAYLRTRFATLALRPERAAERFQALAEESYDQDNPQVAIISLERAHKLRPGEPLPLLLLGQIYLEQGELKAAEASFEAAMQADYSNAQAFKGMGFVYQTMGKPREAIYYYLASLDREPDDLTVLVNLGIVFQDLGRLDDAVQYLERARRLAPDDVIVREQMGRVLFGAGRFDDAVEELKQAIHLDPRESETHQLLAVTYEAVGESDKAAACYQDALERDPENGWAHLGLAGLVDFEEVGSDEAFEHASSAVEIFSAQDNEEGLVQAYWNLGWAGYRCAHYDASITASRKALELAPDLIPVRFNLGLSLLCKGETRRARQEYQRAAEAVGDVWELRVNGINDLEEALEDNPELDGAEEILAMLRDRDRTLSQQRPVATAPPGEELETPVS